jgi:signal transduction histidine kinase
MMDQRAVDHLLPRRESDPKFGEYLDRLGISGLQTLGVVEIAAALVQYFARAAGYSLQTAAMIAVGLLTLAAAGAPLVRRHPRSIAALSTLLAPAMLMLGAAPDDYTITAVMLVFVTAVASIPFLPWHALALGLAYECVYILSSERAISTDIGHGDAHHILFVLFALLGAGVAASNYAHRRNEFRSQQDAVRVAETLTGAQLRAQLAESAISIGKMAAALSHEINSPLGVLRSSIATLCVLSDREAGASPEVLERLRETRAELRRSVEESAARIEEVTARLRRFVNLEEAEIKSADINDLLTDVTVLHRDELDRARVKLEFDFERDIPPLSCRPQLLTAAFSNLLSNAINAVNGDGRIAIATRGRGAEIEVTIRDNGRGMTPEEADTIFDPGFKVAAGRVASANWSLFSSRQIVYEHGGGIRLETAPGQGTAMHVTLPIS